MNLFAIFAVDMKVRLSRVDTVEDYSKSHSNAGVYFRNWLDAIEEADWEEPADITSAFSGNLLGGGSNRVVFDIGGNGRNSHRMICEYAFGLKLVRLYVNWIGSHERYNALSNKDKLTISVY